MRSATLNYARLFAAARGNPEDEKKFWKDFRNDRKNNVVSPHDFSIRELFEGFVFDAHGDRCGHEMVTNWKNGGGDGYSLAELSEGRQNQYGLMEAGPVQKSAFSNITGQIVYNEVMDAWNQPGYISQQLATTRPTSFLDGERIPGISVVADDAEVVGEAQPYPYSGLSEQYVDTPAPAKRGHIVSLTRESIIADRTGVILDRANTVTNSLLVNKEKRVIDVALGVTTSWRRNGSAATATYANSGTKPHDFDNLAASNGLTDWKNVQTALLLFDGMTDPDTAEPIVVIPTLMVVPSALLMDAQRILNATGVDTRSGATLAAGDPTEADRVTIGGNPLVGTNLSVASNAFVFSRTSSATTWFVGDFNRAFRYMQVWDINAIQAPTNSHDEFTRDIVEQYKVSEYGVPAVVEPRYVVKCTA